MTLRVAVLWFILIASWTCAASAEDQAVSADALRESYERAQVFLREGRPDMARQEFERAIRMKPDFFQAHYMVGMICVQQEDFACSKARLEEAIALEPKHANARYLFATTLTRLGKFDSAKEEYRQAILNDPNQMRAYHDLGVLSYRTEDWHLAEDMFEKSRSLAPDQPVTMMMLGMTYVRTKKPEKVIEMILELRRVGDEKKADSLERLLRDSQPKPPDESVLTPKAPAGAKRPPQPVQTQQKPKQKSKNPFSRR